MASLEATPLYPKFSPAPGTTLETKGNVPTLFTPLRIRGMHLQNRFVMSPVGTFSARDGHLTDYHLVHLGAISLHGTALTVVEATAVTPNGRCSPQDSGLWKDSQVAPLKRIVDFMHSQGQNAGIQLYHTGSNASMLAPWLSTRGKHALATEADGGWPNDLWAPSPIPYTEEHPVPIEMNKEQIELVIQAFVDAAKRAVQAGVDCLEIHGAHGYIIHQFLSPLTNHRTDEYGGSFENRTRFLMRIIQGVRAAIPDNVAMSLRISGTEWMEWSDEPSWTMEDSIKLAKLLPRAGVDILDVSSGGNHRDQKIDIHPYYQVDLAGRIRRTLRADGINMIIAAVGFIDNAKMARDIVQQVDGEDAKDADGANGTRGGPQADLVFVARQFLREPEFVFKCAKELGVKVQWPLQNLRAQ